MELTQIAISAVVIVGGAFSVLVGGSYWAYKMKQKKNINR